jgi:hypothetical protein
MVALLKTPPQMAIAGSIEPAKQGAERRMFPRRELHARVEGKRIDHSLTALRQPHLEMALRDLSVGGLSAISTSPLMKGERLSVSFPAQSAAGRLHAGWDAVGRVIRCEPSVLGYRVAVEFESVPAAA